MSTSDQAPEISYDWKRKTASYRYQGRTYQLAGQYETFSEAQHAAHQQCREMGWNG